MAVVLVGCGAPVAEIQPVASDVEREQLAVASIPAADEADWPWWRGPRGDNHAAGPAPPVEWSERENIAWKASVPGEGHATPIVVGQQVLVQTADPSQETMSLVCFDRRDGRQLWTCQLHRGGFMHTHSKNSHASATPAWDGRHAIALNMVQGAIWATAIDSEGKIAWQTEVGPFRSMHGYGSSPLLYRSLVIVAGDNPGSGFLAALDRTTGDIVWRVRRANKASFATPIIASVDGRDQIVLSGQDAVTGYDPATGEQLWRASGPATTTANTVAAGDSLLIASGGYPQRGIVAIRADGSGKSEWTVSQKVYVPSPLVVGERVYVVQDNGIARCLQLKTGKELWNRRLSGDFSASPVLAGDLIFVPNEQGKLFVFRAADTFEQVAEHSFANGIFASPVICGGQLFVRTRSELYCIADQGNRPAPE